MSRAKNGSDENAGACAHERIYDVRIREMKAIATYGYAHEYEHTYSSVVRVCVGGGGMCAARTHMSCTRSRSEGSACCRQRSGTLAADGPQLAWRLHSCPVQVPRAHTREFVCVCVCVCVCARAC